MSARCDIRVATLVLLASLVSGAALASPDSSQRAGVVLAVTTQGTPSSTPLALPPPTGQAISAPDDQVLDILFTDATTVRLARGTRVTLRAYGFEPATGTGSLHLNLLHGSVRINGGKLGAGRSIVVSTPAGIVTVGQSVVVITFVDGVMQTTLISGAPVTASSGSESQSLERPGFAVSATQAGGLESPEQQSQGDLRKLVFLFNPALGGEEPAGGKDKKGETQLALNDVRDQSNDGDGGGPPPPPPTYTPFTGNTGDGSGFPTTIETAPNWATEDISVDNEFTRKILTQGTSLAPDNTLTPRPAGLSTARVFLSGFSLSQQLSADSSLNPTDTVSYPTHDPTREFDGSPHVNPGAALYVNGQTTTNNFQYTLFNEVAASSATPTTVPVFARYLFLGPPNAELNTDGPIRINIDRAARFLERPTPEDFGTRFFSFSDGRKGENAYRVGFYFEDEEKDIFQRTDGVVWAGVAYAGFWRRSDGFIERDNDNFLAFQLFRADFVAPIPLGRFYSLSQEGVFFFAAGDVDNAPPPDRRLDTFFISAGLAHEYGPQTNGAGFLQPEIRAFLRTETLGDLATSPSPWPNLPDLKDTGLLVIGAPQSSTQLGASGAVQTAALHADFGVLKDVANHFVDSTISVTIGEVRYQTNLDYASPTVDFTDTVPVGSAQGLRQEVGFTAHTVGSMASGGAPTIMTTNLFNTAAGGGNPWDTGQPLYEQLPGRVGYLVIENYQPSLGNVAGNGGVEHAVGTGTATDTEYAILRLASGATSTALASNPLLDLDAQGFAGALEYRENGTNPVTVAEFRSDTLSLKGSSSTNRMVANLDATHVLGGPTDPTQADDASRGASAYIDADRFGARTPSNSLGGQDLALVSSDVLKGGAGGNVDTDTVLTTFDQVKSVATTLKWGFFFGDTGNTGGNRSSVHLGTWVAGDVLDTSRLPTSGNATYAGKAIGNVINNGSAYTAVGDYSGTWNFGTQQGTATLTFDSATQTGAVSLVAGPSGHFYGVLEGGSRLAEINGAFIGGGASVGAAPNGQIGNFGVSGANYGAAGTFAASKQ